MGLLNFSFHVPHTLELDDETIDQMNTIEDLVSEDRDDPSWSESEADQYRDTARQLGEKHIYRSAGQWKFF